VSHYLPNKYRSETVMLVVPQQVPENYVRSAVTAKLEDRMQSINQQILSRTRLERIIHDFNLYENERRVGIMEDVIEKMRTKDIDVRVLKGDAFLIAYSGDNPQVVRRVTERLASAFIEENLRDRELLAEGTNQFLTVQLEDARRRLIEQEKKLEAYRVQHAGELPSQATGNLQAIQNLQMQIQQIVESINRDIDRRLLIERNLSEATAASAAGIVDAGQTPQTAVAQLAAAQKTLNDMQLRLTAEHPDVIRMRRIIAGLEKKVETEASLAPLTPEATPAMTIAAQGQRSRIGQLQFELEKIDRDVAAKRAEEQRLRRVASAYQARVEAVPARETELAELTRDYETLQKMYASLLGKSQESKIAANLERRQIGEQLKVLDPARTPERPFSPNRPLINFAGALGGLFFGLALAGFLEYRDSSFRTHDEVATVLSLPVLAQIPLIVTRGERARFRRRRLMVAASAAVVSLAIAAALWRIGVFNGLIQMVRAYV
jgi:polysaccharide chain length determinant protein (PEP-CTERM system associated)